MQKKTKGEGQTCKWEPNESMFKGNRNYSLERRNPSPRHQKKKKKKEKATAMALGHSCITTTIILVRNKKKPRFFLSKNKYLKGVLELKEQSFFS
jgi:hypothetical protein